MILLVHPGKEGLVLVVEDTTSNVPVLVATSITKNTETNKQVLQKIAIPTFTTQDTRTVNLAKRIELIYSYFFKVNIAFVLVV